MHISDAALDEFIAIYKEELKEDIDRETAREMAEGLLRLYSALSRPLPEDGTSATQRDASR